MKIYENFDIKKGDIITITGAGGKSSLLFSIALELSAIGTVAITTSTNIDLPKPHLYEKVVTKTTEIKGNQKNIFVFGTSIENGKLTTFGNHEIKKLSNLYDFILIEGDGANEKLLKEWKENEPYIPSFSNKVIGVINMDIFNKSISEENIYQFELFSTKFFNYLSSTINKDFLVEYIQKAQFFKNSPNSEKYILFNGIDGENSLRKFSIATEIANELIKTNFTPKILFGSMNAHEIFSYTPISAILLTTDKDRVMYNGTSLLENILEKLNLISFFEVIVCGNNKWAENISEIYNFKYIDCKNLNSGQVESIRTAISNSLGKGYVFFLGDQPSLTLNTIEKLYYNFEKYKYITIPQAKGEKFFPIFVPESKKDELLNLQGKNIQEEIIKNSPLLSIINFDYNDEFIRIIDLDFELY